MRQAIRVEHVRVLVIFLVKLRQVDPGPFMRDVAADLVSELTKFRRELWRGLLWVIT